MNSTIWKLKRAFAWLKPQNVHEKNIIEFFIDKNKNSIFSGINTNTNK